MKKILVVEDNELNRKLIVDVLETRDYSVETAKDGQEGLDKAEADDFDLILLDIQMPLVSGYDFLERYKKDTPVIVVSACAMDVEIEKALNLGAAAYVSKPIQILEFLETVANFVS